MAENVIVSVRWRPLVKRELQSSSDDNRQFDWSWNDNQVMLNLTDKTWGFDNVFGTDSTNKGIYEKVVKPIVQKAIDGYNGTVFAYGQTGSGKTFTMRGYDGEQGVIPLAVKEICGAIQQCQEREFMMAMEYIEIYNEQIQDLLSPPEKTQTRRPIITEDDSGNVKVEGIEKPLVDSETTILELLERGDKRRATSATNMNEHSSRSHAIFRLRIESRRKDDPGAIMCSQLNLVDLAGSERAAQTGASGQTLKEGCHINKSLFMLGRVINELTTNAGHVSYRDSILTRILSPALGGNARTAIICTVTEASGQETKSSLNFSASAKLIKNTLKKNQVLTNEALLSRQEKEIKRLKAECERLKTQQNQPDTQGEDTKEMQRRIETLQKMVLNSTSVDNQPVSKRPVRRMTWHPNQTSSRPSKMVKRSSGDAFNDENEFVNASAFVDLLDQEEEMTRLGMKRTLTERSPPKLNSQETFKRNKMDSFEQFSQEPVILGRAIIDFDQLEVQLKQKTNELHKSNSDYTLAKSKIVQLEEELQKTKGSLLFTTIPEASITQLEAAHNSREAELEKENSSLKRELVEVRKNYAALQEVKGNNTFNSTKLLEQLEIENVNLKEKLAFGEAEFSKKTAALDEKLALWGNAKSPDEFIGQIKNLHIQLQEKAKFVNTLEEKTDLKSNEIKLLSEQLRDLESSKVDPVNTSTIDEIALLQTNLKELHKTLQSEAIEKEELKAALFLLKEEKNSTYTPSPARTPAPGNMTMAYQLNEEMIEDIAAKEREIEKLRSELETLKSETNDDSSQERLRTELAELHEFFDMEKEVTKSVSDDNESLRKENSLLKTQVENSSRITDISSINEAHLKRTENDWLSLETEIARLNAELATVTLGLEGVRSKAIENERYGQINAELEYQMEVDQAKSKRRINELIGELSVFRDIVVIKEKADAELQTLETDVVDVGCLAMPDLVHTGTAVDQDMPQSPEIIYLQDQVKELNTKLAQAEARADGVTTSVDIYIEELQTKVEAAEKLHQLHQQGIQTKDEQLQAVENVSQELKLRLTEIQAKQEMKEVAYIELAEKFESAENRLAMNMKASHDKDDVIEIAFLEANNKDEEIKRLGAKIIELQAAIDDHNEDVLMIQALKAEINELGGLAEALETARSEVANLNTKFNEANIDFEIMKASHLEEVDRIKHEAAKALSELTPDDADTLVALRKESEDKDASLKFMLEQTNDIREELGKARLALMEKETTIIVLNGQLEKLKDEPVNVDFRKPRLSDLGICDISAEDSIVIDIKQKQETTDVLSRTEMSALGIADASSRKASIDFGHQVQLLEYEDKSAELGQRLASVTEERDLALTMVGDLKLALAQSEDTVVSLTKDLNASTTDTHDSPDLVPLDTEIIRTELVDMTQRVEELEIERQKIQEELSNVCIENTRILRMKDEEIIKLSEDVESRKLISDQYCQKISLLEGKISELNELSEQIQTLEDVRIENNRILSTKDEEITKLSQDVKSASQAKEDISSQSSQQILAQESVLQGKICELNEKAEQIKSLEEAINQETIARLKFEETISNLNAEMEIFHRVQVAKDQLEIELTSSRLLVEELSRKLELLSCERSESQNLLVSKYDDELKLVNVENEKLKSSLESKGQEIEKLGEDLKLTLGELKSLEEKFAERESSITDLTEQVKKSADELGSKQDQLDSALSEAKKVNLMEELRTELIETKKMSEELFSKKKELEDQIQKKDDILKQSAMKFKDYVEEIEELKNENVTLRETNIALQKTIENKTKELQECKESIHGLNLERAELLTTIEDLEAIKVKYNVVVQDKELFGKEKIDNRHLKKRLEEACEFNDAEVKKREHLQVQLNELVKERDTLKGEVAAHEKDSLKYRSQLSECETLLFTKEESLVSIGSELQDLKEKLSVLKNQPQNTEELRMKNEQIQRLEATLTKFRKEVEDIRSEIDLKDDVVTNLKCENSRLESDNNGMKRRLQSNKSTLNLVEQEFKKVQSDLESKSAKISQLEAIERTLQSQIDELQRQQRLRQTSEVSDEVVQKLQQDKRELQKLYQDMEIRKDRYKARLDGNTLLAERDNIKEKLSKYFNLYKGAQAEIKALASQLASKESVSPPMPLSTQALLGETQIPEAQPTTVAGKQSPKKKALPPKVPKTDLERPISPPAASPARSTRSRSKSQKKEKEEADQCKQQ